LNRSGEAGYIDHVYSSSLLHGSPQTFLDEAPRF
jgi:hypothetical protein